MNTIFGIIITMAICAGVASRETSDKSRNQLRKKFFAQLSTISYAIAVTFGFTLMFL